MLRRMEKKAAYTPKAGTNVFATVDGKEIGPIYLVQIEGDKATLQGGETHVIPVSDIIKEA
jgi:hypothetical protein